MIRSTAVESTIYISVGGPHTNNDEAALKIPLWDAGLSTLALMDLSYLIMAARNDQHLVLTFFQKASRIYFPRAFPLVVAPTV